MKINNENNTDFEFDEKFKARALELLDGSQALQFAEGLRLGSALSNVSAREYDRIKRKYGKDHPRTLEMAVRVAANMEAKKGLFMRYTEASTPYANPGEGWAVDGFVRTANGDPVEGVTVAAYDRQERWYQKLGYACTDGKGYFQIIAEKVPDEELSVYMRASKGNKLLESNEVQLAPEPKSSDRVEIIIGDIAGKGDCMPPTGGKGEPRPPEKPGGGKEKPAAPVKEAKDTGTITASGPTDEQKAKALKNEAEKLKESGNKANVAGRQKKPPKKGRK